MVNFNKTQTVRQINFHHIKRRLLQFLQMLLILIMNINLHLHPNSNYYCQLNVKCAFLKDKQCILLLHTNIYIYIYMAVFKYNTGGGGVRSPYVYVGGAHEKKVGNHCHNL